MALLFFLRPVAVREEGRAVPAVGAVKAQSTGGVQASSAAQAPAFVAEEARRMGSIDPHPEATRQRLEEWARDVDAQRAGDLAALVLEKGRSQDERFLAAYLLALVPGEHAVPALRDVALRPLSAPAMGQKDQDRLHAVEVQVRAAAIEGLARHRGSEAARSALEDAARAHQDQFLTDRAHRALHEWRTGASVEDQDRKALGRVLDR